MRYIKYAILASIATALVVVAVANSQVVTLRLLPTALSDGLGFEFAPTIDLPLFAVVIGSFLLGLFVGFIWELIREGRQRRSGRRAEREARKLERQVKELKGPDPATGDDVLALVDKKAS